MGDVAATATAVAAVRATCHPPVQVQAPVVAARHLMIVSEALAAAANVRRLLKNTVKDVMPWHS